MVVVMKREATEADIEQVSERVRAAGGEAFVSRGAVHTIVGLVGDTERFQAIPWRQLPGVDHVIQIGKPYKMVAADLHPDPTTVNVGSTPVGRGTFTLIAGPCAVESEEQAMLATKAAQRRGRHDPARRRLQAADVALLVPGARRTGARGPGGVPASDRAADRRGGRRRLAGGARRRGRRLHPRRYAERPELRAPEGGRAVPPARDAEARPRDDDRGVAPGRRVRRPTRQLRDHPVRTRDPDLRAGHAQHPRPRGDGGRADRVPPARDRRPVARRRQAAPGRADVARGARRRRRRGDDRRAPRSRERPVRRPAGPHAGRDARSRSRARAACGVPSGARSTTPVDDRQTVRLTRTGRPAV